MLPPASLKRYAKILELFATTDIELFTDEWAEYQALDPLDRAELIERIYPEMAELIAMKLAEMRTKDPTWTWAK